MDLVSTRNVEQVRAEIPKIHSIHPYSIDPYPGRIIASCKCIRMSWNDFHDHSIPSVYIVVKIGDQRKKGLNLLRLRGIADVAGLVHPLSFRHTFTVKSGKISTENPLSRVPLFRKEKKVCFWDSNTKISAATITPFAFGSVRSSLIWVLGLHWTIFQGTKVGSQVVSPVLEPWRDQIKYILVNS